MNYNKSLGYKIKKVQRHFGNPLTFLDYNPSYGFKLSKIEYPVPLDLMYIGEIPLSTAIKLYNHRFFKTKIPFLYKGNVRCKDGITTGYYLLDKEGDIIKGYNTFDNTKEEIFNDAIQFKNANPAIFDFNIAEQMK